LPLKDYGVLVGRVIASRAEGSADSPHFQVQVRAVGIDFRIAVNVLSKEKPSELLYLAEEHFSHPLLALLPALSEGFTSLASQSGGVALDFIRGNLFERTAMKPMPATSPGPDNDLADLLAHFVNRAAADPEARVYAFGERWGPEAGVPDKIFGFEPGNGVHDIHMNQGNSIEFESDDGVWQDGGLLLHFPGAEQWVAIFLAFQSQAWHTDDLTGHLIKGPDLGPGNDPSGSEPDHTLRIIAALVNPVGPAPETETVTLLNPGTEPVDMAGWSLIDHQARVMTLDAMIIPPGEAVRLTLKTPVQLGNSGGLLTLLNATGLKVDGIAYTKDQVRIEGRTLVF
jgi:uncharacterized protein YukJ